MKSKYGGGICFLLSLQSQCVVSYSDADLKLMMMKLLRKTLGLIVFSHFIGIFSADAQDVAPMLHTRWGQTGPFNALCPPDSSGQSLAGCGPVAMAQVIRCMQYPSVSPFDGHEYQWHDMAGVVTDVSKEAEQTAVARLMRDCGVTAFTNYGARASSTRLGNMVNAMKKLFAFSPYMMAVDRGDYEGEEGARVWRDMIFGELRHGRCVIARGSMKDKADGGHIFVIDGLRDTMVHVNFGWAGKSDGWYPLDRPGPYTEGIKMVVHIADSTYRPEMKEVVVAREGQLRGCLPDMEWATVQSLRVTGRLNADDIRWLRRVSGRKAFGQKNGQLSVLDLSGAEMDMLPDSAFMRSASLVQIALPGGLRIIGQRAFQDCVNLNHVDIPPSVWKIRGGAFVGCVNLLDIIIPEGVRNILSFTFAGCANLTTVRLPESIDTLGYRVFDRCERLEKLYIPARTSHIGTALVDRCPHVEVTVDGRNRMFRAVDGRLEGVTKEAKMMLGERGEAGARKDIRVSIPVQQGNKVVSRYKMVNGKKVFMGYVTEDGKLVKVPSVPRKK